MKIIIFCYVLLLISCEAKPKAPATSSSDKKKKPKPAPPKEFGSTKSDEKSYSAVTLINEFGKLKVTYVDKSTNVETSLSEPSKLFIEVSRSALLSGLCVNGTCPSYLSAEISIPEICASNTPFQYALIGVNPLTKLVDYNMKTSLAFSFAFFALDSFERQKMSCTVLSGLDYPICDEKKSENGFYYDLPNSNMIPTEFIPRHADDNVAIPFYGLQNIVLGPELDFASLEFQVSPVLLSYKGYLAGIAVALPASYFFNPSSKVEGYYPQPKKAWGWSSKGIPSVGPRKWSVTYNKESDTFQILFEISTLQSEVSESLSNTASSLSTVELFENDLYVSVAVVCAMLLLVVVGGTWSYRTYHGKFSFPVLQFFPRFPSRDGHNSYTSDDRANTADTNNSNIMDDSHNSVLIGLKEAFDDITVMPAEMAATSAPSSFGEKRLGKLLADVHKRWEGVKVYRTTLYDTPPLFSKNRITFKLSKPTKEQFPVPLDGL